MVSKGLIKIMKKLKVFNLIFVMIQIVFLLFTITNIAYADMNQIYTRTYNPFSDSISIIIGAIQAVGMSVAVIMLTYIGIKYIWSSPDGKAELKQQLFPYFIGCVLLFGSSWLIGVIADFANTKIK